MKNCFKLSFCTFLLGAAMALVSCQEEEPFEEDVDSEKTLVAHGDELELLKRVVDNDGSYDNIVDGASCVGIQFPYTVVVNGLEIKVDSMGDLELVEAKLDALELAQEICNMAIVYPITVTLSDYSELTVNDEDELYEITQSCIEGGNDDDIECIDVIYPLTVFTYNPDFQLLNTLKLDGDMQFRRFLAGLGESDLISFEFPVSFGYGNGEKVTANNNSELVEAIEEAKTTCDEDDDADYNDDDFTQDGLDKLLGKCPWSIRPLKKSEQDNTEQYPYYFLTFEEGGKVIAGDEYGYATEGTWGTGVSDYRVILKVEFAEAPDFNGSWWVYGLGEGKIALFTDEEGDRMLLEMACDYEPNLCSEEHIIESLKECKWEILNEDGSFFEELYLDFSAEMSLHVYNSDATLVDEGSWSISGNVVTLSKLSETLANYVGDWKVMACGDDKFELDRREETIVFKIKCEK
ncbi:hypothetical protein [Pseudozobellia thermophila]|uniref:Uncharacterized protein n=1 Tax=Pseudozobellia thermophila TaxID=192903 RepID=A0A1M6MB22_9FLAO|nr:hypothetical protein [Pseudozobellia thermophila]SHJ80666.1 hypothetical protein SAMN04488513_10976 [Pseudozobellia thermophila]